MVYGRKLTYGVDIIPLVLINNSSFKHLICTSSNASTFRFDKSTVAVRSINLALQIVVDLNW